VRQHATYAAVLERYLGRRGVKAEVLNAGVSGFSNAEALAYLENEGHRYQPDVVVLGFYANDFEDNLKAGLFKLEGEKLVEVKREHVPGVRLQNTIYAIPGVRWLSENSYAYSVLFNGVWLHFKNAMQARASTAAPADVPELEYAVARKSGHSPYEIGLASALIERMRAFCESRGIRFIVAEIPQTTDDRYRFVDSLPPGMLKDVEVVASRALLDDLDGAVQVHLPSGHRHISELTHALIGVELGKRILKR
jgi:hypothetical protein